MRREIVPPSTARFVAELPFPAFIEGRYLDVLAANPLATALSPRLQIGRQPAARRLPRPGGAGAVRPSGNGPRRALVAGFRQSVGTDIDDPRFIELVGELSLASPLFRRLWARHDVAVRSGAAVTFAHPQVGELNLDREKLAVNGTDGLMLVAYHAQPGSESADRLRMLGSIALPTAREAERNTSSAR